MPYTLWSRGRLVGHTDLDVHTVTPTMRQGFVEPTEEGRALLADATGVWRAMAEVKRDARLRGGAGTNDRALVLNAMDRREELELELRDDSGAMVDYKFIQVSDLFDLDGGVVDAMGDTPEEEEAEFEIYLSSLSETERTEALQDRAALIAEADAMVDEFREEQDERDRSGWPPAPPEDPRWDFMQYLLRVHVQANAWEDEGGP
jgi:hypothetical protein